MANFYNAGSEPYDPNTQNTHLHGALNNGTSSSATATGGPAQGYHDGSNNAPVNYSHRPLQEPNGNHANGYADVGDKEKGGDGEELETIHTNERVGSHTNYYEKGGMRTEGDGQDHVGVHHKMSPKLFAALTALSFIWVGSQIPLYLFGGITPTIYGDIGGANKWIWLVTGYLISLAAICPFTGAISDLIGRRYAAVVGTILLIIGMIVASTAKNMNNFIGGMTIAGAGAGINELTALAGAGELVPTGKRGLYVGAVVFTISPFIPSILYAQAIVNVTTWRYVGLLCGLWNFLALVFVLLFYWPPQRLNSEGYSARKVLARIDWIGGLLSISGFLLFLMGLQFSSQQYTWQSANPHILVPFILGVVLIIAFVLWEIFGAKYPMVPGRLFINAREVTLALIITFLSGANFIALLFFWPTESYNVYGNDHIQIGIRGLPIGFGIIGGAVISLLLIGITKGQIRLNMIFFTSLMTAGTGAMAVATPINLNTVYAPLFLASFGVGGVIVPITIVLTIVCPDDLIATITALSLSIRVLGGAIGFAAYYNVFYSKFVGYATEIVGIKALAQQLIQLDPVLDTELVTYAGNDEYNKVANITDGWTNTPYAEEVIMGATQWAFSQAYVWPYYISIAFGSVCVICAIFLGDIKRFLDDHVAVVIG